MTVHRLLSIISVIILVLLLTAVRFFETTLFSEPLYDYFHADFQLIPLPSEKMSMILAVTSLRYLVNTILSLGILWFIYKKKTFIIASLWVYLFAFVILLITMATCLFIEGESAKMILFYARRFLIHPILLFILVAGFYYLRNKELR
jgi:exosortase F-associated protein